jgi:hypothetical protein
MGRVWAFALFLCLLLADSAAAQCPVNDLDDAVPPPLPTVTSSTRSEEPKIPESGYLSNTSYASAYFGFVIDLPIELSGHRIMLPLMPPGQHALLAIGFQQAHKSGTFLITASEPRNPIHEMTDEERRAEELAWAKGEPRNQITPPDWLTRTGHWYHITKHAGDVTTMQYWTFIKNYLIRVKVASNDATFVRKSKEAIAGVKFYCAQEDGTLVNEEGKLVPTPGEGYTGPTIPNSIVDAALSDKPALELIVRGDIEPGAYRNEELGLTYTYPTTWTADHDDPAPEANSKIAERTHDVVDACSLMLIRLSPPRSDQQTADDRWITLRAIDQSCLGLRAPGSPTDRVSNDELAAYLQMLGVIGEVRESKLVEHGNQLFADYSAVLGEPGTGKELRSRGAQAVAVTRHRKMLLVWTWAAPSRAELATMPKTTVSFEGGVPIDLVPDSIATH